MTAFFVLLSLPIAALSLSTPADTVKPLGRLVQPEPLTVITNNSIQLSAEAADSGSGVREVRFYARYYEYVPAMELPSSPSFRLVGRATKPPYKTYWDVSRLPDQDIFRLRIYCDIEDNAGNVLRRAGDLTSWLVLDRNPDTDGRAMACKRTGRDIAIDGRFDDWPPADTVRFSDNDNRITAISAWDGDFLYLGIFVTDHNLQAPKDPGVAYYLFDCISLFFDPDFDRSSIRGPDDIQYNLGIGDTVSGNRYQINVREFQYVPWGENVRSAIRISGTPNDNRDRDSGYVMEIAIPLASFGRAWRAGDSLGFDIFCNDNDHGDTIRMGKGWSGTEIYNNNNPSEWGVLFLASHWWPGPRTFLFAALALLVALAIIIEAANRRRTAGEGIPADPDRKELIVSRIKSYIGANFQRSELTLDVMAAEIGMSASHIRQTFKQVTGRNYSDFLAEFRIERARGLLSSRKDLNITRIAFECGFSSVEYFNKTFKKFNKGRTPSQFRLES